jgi:hypothetical protein
MSCQSLARIDDIDLLDAKRIDVADGCSDVLDVDRVFDDGDQVLAAKRLDGLGALADRWS